METRSETTRESRRRREDEQEPNRRDVTSIAPPTPAGVDDGTATQPDPAAAGSDIRKDQRQKGGTTGSTG